MSFFILVPVFDDTIFEEIQPVSGTTEATLTLKKRYFSDMSGTLQYIAIIVSSSNTSAGSFDQWKDDSIWPVPSSNETEIYYQATPKFWYPFKGKKYIHIFFNNTFNALLISQCSQLGKVLKIYKS